MTRARAKATLCRSPPEISRGLRSRRVRDAKGFENGSALFSPLVFVSIGQAILDIFSDREMRKKSEVLENIA